jgi:hypothetical protein
MALSVILLGRGEMTNPMFTIPLRSPGLRPRLRPGTPSGRFARGLCALLVPVLISLTATGCQPSDTGVIRLFSALPKRNYDSIECTNLLAARKLLGLPAVGHGSPVADRLAYFSRMDPFTFSMEEYSFLISDKTPLGFDPSDFLVSVVARAPSDSVTVVRGDFAVKTIVRRLDDSGYRTMKYKGYTLYGLPWSDAPDQGGLPLTFSNLTFVDGDLIAYAPTERLLKDYIDRLQVGSLTDDVAVMQLVQRLEGACSFYLSRGIRRDELYGEDSLFIRRPEDWGLADYRLSPYIYFAFGIWPAADRKRQDVTLLIIYPDSASAARDRTVLSDGLRRGKSLSRLVPFSELFSVKDVTAQGEILEVLLQSKGDFDIKPLIRLKDLPFLVY